MNDNDSLTIVADKISAYQAKSIRVAKLEITFLSLMIAGIIAYLSFLYVAVVTLDSGQVAHMMSSKLESSLPSLRETFRVRALEAAPELTQQGADMLVQLPEILRVTAESSLTASLDQWGQEAEKNINGYLTESLESAWQEIQKTEGASDQEKIHSLIGVMRKDLNIQASGILDTLSAEYRYQLRAFTEQLRKLLKNDSLTQEEEIHRELIEIWAVLSMQHKIFDFHDA